MRRLPLSLLAFAAVAVFWLTAVGALGAVTVAAQPHAGVLPATFDWWETVPASRHFFLGQYHAGDYLANRVYGSYTPFFLLSLYLVLAPLKHATALPYAVVQNVMPFLLAPACGALVIFWNRAWLPVRANRAFTRDGLAFFLLTGLALTHPPLWLSLLGFNRDHFHLLAALVFCHLVLGGGMRRYGAWGLVLALIAPIHVPAWALVGLALGAPRWRRTVVGVGAAAVAAIALPHVMAHVGGYQNVGSSFFYRSGLDGSTEHMRNLFQAVWRPEIASARPWPLWLYVLAPAAAALALRSSDRDGAHHVARAGLVLAVPYLCTAILFPQFTSIHPYLADPLLSVPATALLLHAGFRMKVEAMDGLPWVYWLLAAGTLLMSNLLSLAQGFRAVS